MKDLYHICLTAHDEVLLRNEEDARQMQNFSALSAHRTDSEMLTDSEMSTHLHWNLSTNNPKEYIFRYKDSFTANYNYRHSRKGSLFDNNPFFVKLEGPHRIQMSLSYGLRQGMHHGITQTPYQYPWCTCNHLFTKERGIPTEKPMYTTHSEIASLFAYGTDIPDNWQADKNGILVRSSFENLTLVENWYGTCRGFMTCMNRKTTDEWLAEQAQDGIDAPLISLDLLEWGFNSVEIKDMLHNECNPKYVRRTETDMDICKLIDGTMLGKYHADSVYQLDITQKLMILKELYYDKNLRNLKQLARCLVLKY